VSAAQGHTDMITAAAPFPGQPPLFITGSKDGQVRNFIGVSFNDAEATHRLMEHASLCIPNG